MKACRPRLLVLALLTWGLAGCGSGAQPEVREHPYTFLGVATDIQMGDDYGVGPRPWVFSPGEAGGGDFTVGPATIVLHDGTELSVPADTPGGNACEELYDPASMDLREGESVDSWEQETGVPKPTECVLIGSADDSGRVEWFQVLNRQWSGWLVHVGSAVEVVDGGTVLVSDGYRFAVSESVTINCLSGRYSDVAQLVEERPGLQETILDPRTGEVIALNCVSDN